MEEYQKLNAILTFLILGVILLSVLIGVNISKVNQIEPVEITETIVNVTTVEYVTPEYILSKTEFEDNAIEVEALRLADLEFSSRDLYKSIFNALVDHNVSIESYKDITDLKIIEFDVDGNEVTYDVKVYYFVDGDEDEDFRARLNEFTIEVNDLDFDDEFVDAEANSDYLDNISVKKVYN